MNRVAICIGIAIMMSIFRGCGPAFRAPDPTPADLVGHWVGDFNPIAVLKPKLPVGTIHDISLSADMTCRVQGFLEDVRGDLPPKIYGGDGQWRLEQRKDGTWSMVVTLMLDGFRYEDALRMIWIDDSWELSLEWSDPDVTNDLRFKRKP